MIDQRVKTLLRDNKNTRLHVLMVLWASPEPLSAKDISDELDCHPDTVQALLPRMFAGGYVSQWPDGRHPKWWVGENAGQLYLPGLSLLAEGEKVTLKPASEGEKVTLTPELRVNAHTLTASAAAAASYQIPLIKSSSSRNSEGENHPQKSNGRSAGRKTHAARAAAAAEGLDPALVAAFRSAGIGSNAWADLAECEWVTPDFVRAHDAYRRSRGESVGLLITRLLAGDEVPEVRQTDRRDVGDVWARDLAVARRTAAPPADSSPDGGTDEEDEGDQPAPLKQARFGVSSAVWSAICDQVIARDPELFTECLAHVRPVSLRAGVLRLIMPLRINRLYLANEKEFLEFVADVLDDELVRVDLEVWGPR